jgi:hypothetical protein
MTEKEDRDKRFSLKRWSQRKLDAVAAPAPPPATAAVPAPLAPAAAPVASTPPELPPVESLHFDSDFTAFLRPDVDEKLKRAALKQLFRDPRFNVMDGLDTYIDDYTKADPIPTDVLAELLQRGFGRGDEPSDRKVAVSDASRASPTAHDEAPPSGSPESERAVGTLGPPPSQAQASPTLPVEPAAQTGPAQACAADAGPAPKKR